MLCLTAGGVSRAAPVERADAQEDDDGGGVHWLLERTHLSTLMFLHYGGGEQGGERFNKFFAELRWPAVGGAVFSRYDWFRWEDADLETSGRLIAGLAYFFFHDCGLVTDVDHVWWLDSDQPNDWQVKLTLQISLP
jgi:hypothetical protein